MADNGKGVPPADYASLGLKYHTSKLHTFNDLEVRRCLMLHTSAHTHTDTRARSRTYRSHTHALRFVDPSCTADLRVCADVVYLWLSWRGAQLSVCLGRRDSGHTYSRPAGVTHTHTLARTHKQTHTLSPTVHKLYVGVFVHTCVCVCVCVHVCVNPHRLVLV